MDNVLKKKPVNMEDMQAYTRILSNQGIVSEGVCSTAADTAAKTVTLGATFSLEDKATILVTFTNGISVANSTLAITHTNIAGTEITETAKPIYLNGAALEADVIPEGARIILRYNGTQFDVIGGAGGRTYTNGDGISIVNNEISVKAGTNLSIDSNGYLNATDTTYSDATTTDSGLMSASDKTKLNGIESGANNYSLPTASANTLGGVKVGDNLSIDQNGVLSAQASSPDEVQIGGNTPSSDSDIKIFIDTTEDAIAEVYTKQQQDGKFVVIKDLNAAPTESTLTYTENGTIKNFKQGDEVRVPDQNADNGYTFYKLYELTTSDNTTTATWDKLGAGSGDIVFPEFVAIQLTQSGGSDSALIGATVVVTNDDTSATILSTTWQGSDIAVQVNAGVDYTVAVGSITDYIIRQNTQSYTAVSGLSRIIEFSYFGNAVDMGLPSGILWARKNLDASQTSGFAANEFQYNCSFFSWGNVVGHNPISDSAFSYDFGTGNTDSYASTPGAALTGNIPVSKDYDAARNILGEPWRMPTQDDFVELINGCDFVQSDGTTVISGTDKRVTINNVIGIYLKSKTNGNLLFLPCSGRGKGTEWQSKGDNGGYWASTLPSNTNMGTYLLFDSSSVNPQKTGTRYVGFTIRPVL